MNIIAAVDTNWAIGYKGKLLVNILADMRFFRDETTGKVVVMGRKTLESLPNKRPLEDRVNLILSTKTDYFVKGATVVNSVEEAMDFLDDYEDKDVYIVGGGSIYRQFLPYCDVAHITKVDYAYLADTYHPDLDKDQDWQIEMKSEEQTCYNIEYHFMKYVKKVLKKY